MKKSNKAFYSLLLISLTGCAVPTDTVINIKIKVTDLDQVVYNYCTYTLFDNEKILLSYSGPGDTHYSDVMPSFNYKKSYLAVTCNDGLEVKKLPLPKLPLGVNDYVNFGTIEIPRKLNN